MRSPNTDPPNADNLYVAEFQCRTGRQVLASMGFTGRLDMGRPYRGNDMQSAVAYRPLEKPEIVRAPWDWDKVNKGIGEKKTTIPSLLELEEFKHMATNQWFSALPDGPERRGKPRPSALYRGEEYGYGDVLAENPPDCLWYNGDAETLPPSPAESPTTIIPSSEPPEAPSSPPTSDVEKYKDQIEQGTFKGPVLRMPGRPKADGDSAEEETASVPDGADDEGVQAGPSTARTTAQVSGSGKRARVADKDAGQATNVFKRRKSKRSQSF